MDHKRTYKNLCKSSSRNFANLGLSAVYAAVHMFFGETNVFKSAKYVFDERPKMIASRLVQLSDDFDKELMPGHCCTCDVLPFLLMLVRWLIRY